MRRPIILSARPVVPLSHVQLLAAGLQPLRGRRTLHTSPRLHTPNRASSSSSPSPTSALPTDSPASAATPSSPPNTAGPKSLDPDKPSATTAQTQTAADWRIIRQLATNIWPSGPGSLSTKTRVIGALGLLVAGKVLNVQVPFFFKDVVDALNVPITAESSVWILAGASIAGCESLRPVGGRIERWRVEVARGCR